MSDLVLVRTTERGRFKECRQAWQWQYVDRLEPVQRSKALTFGGVVHEALARWLPPGRKRGQHPAEAFAEIFDEQGEDFMQYDEDDAQLDARELGIAMLTGYVKHYGKDPDWEMVQPEMNFQIDVHLKDGTYLCTYVGTFDGVARSRSTGRLFLPEHKTAKSISMVRINSRYGEQGLSYWWAANMWLRHLGFLKEHERIDHVKFNFLRKALPDERPTDGDGYRLNKPKKEALLEACAAHDLYLPGKPTVEQYRQALIDNGIDPDQYGEVSAKQPAPLFERQELTFGSNTLATFNRRLRMEAFEMKQAREGTLPIYKNPGQHCDWCAFQAACEVHEMGGHWQDIIALDFKAWDPYEQHELEAEHSR